MRFLKVAGEGLGKGRGVRHVTAFCQFPCRPGTIFTAV